MEATLNPRPAAFTGRRQEARVARHAQFRRCALNSLFLVLSARLYLSASVTGVAEPDILDQGVITGSNLDDTQGGARAWGADSLPGFDATAAQAATQLLKENIADASAALKEVAAQITEQRASLVQAAGDAFRHISEQSALCAACAVDNMRQAVAQLSEQQASFMLFASQKASELVARQAQIKHSTGEAAARVAHSFRESPAVMKAAAAHVREQHATIQAAANEAIAQLSNWQLQVTNAASQTAAQFIESVAERQAQLVETAAQAQLQVKNAASQTAAQFIESVAERQAQLVETAAHAQLQVKNAASQTAAQFIESVAERQAQLVETAAQAAGGAAAQFIESVAERKAQLVVTAAQAAGGATEPQLALRRAVAAVGAHLSGHQAALAEAASVAAAGLSRSAASGQETLRQAAATAAELLQEHDRLLRQSSSLIVGLAEIQATLSPSAGRISAQLAELQRLSEVANEGECLVDPPSELAVQQQSPRQDLKPFAFAYVLSMKALVQRLGLEVCVASFLLSIVGTCISSTVYTIRHGGGEDLASLGFDRLLGRAACWIAHRVSLGWTLVLLSDRLEDSLQVPKYDAMGWPMWATLLPITSTVIFFIPAAVTLNTAVALRSRTRYSTPSTRRFYASLSREVHASIVGCFLSDWLLFPTDIIFFVHHLLGLGIIYGVWSMVLREATSLTSEGRQASTTISFWWVTGLSIATMEAASFFFNLYSLMNFGNVLNLSLFAVYTYSNMLSIMCVTAWHPWGTSLRLFMSAHGQLTDAFEGAQTICARLPLPGWLSPKVAHASMSYLLKALMILVICLARQQRMWSNIGEHASASSSFVVGSVAVALAAACVWRLRDFETDSTQGSQ